MNEYSASSRELLRGLLYSLLPYISRHRLRVINKSGSSTNYCLYIHPSFHVLSAHSVPISLTSSLGEFIGYRDWLWSHGISPVLVSNELPFALNLSVFLLNLLPLT